MDTFQNIPAIQAASASDWRKWLAENHLLQEKVWLILHNKSSGKPSVTYDEAVNEALCFGWIDSVAKKRDATSRYQYFARRKPRSNWSAVNKAKVERMLAEGKMAPEGLRLVNLAKESGTWDALNEVDLLLIPNDLRMALETYPPAEANFDAFPKSTKRGILEWISNAKQASTRAKRIEETAKLAQANLRANQYPPQRLPEP